MGWVPSAILYLVFLSDIALGKNSVHKIEMSDSSWTYLDKFCYSDTGMLEVSLTNDPDQRYALQGIAVYSSDQWERIQGSWTLDCVNKIDVRTRMAHINIKNGFHRFPINYMRPSYWFFVLYNCPYTNYNETYMGGMLKATVSFNMTNDGGFSVAEFGRDEHGIYEMSIVFFIVYLLQLAFLVHIKKECKRKHLQHRIVKRLAISVAASVCAMLFKLIWCGDISSSGQENDSLDGTYTFFNVIADLALLTVAVDLAKGYTISTNHVTRRTTATICAGIFVLNLVLLLASYSRDKASTEYIYDSTAGYIVIAARIAVFLWVARTLWTTYSQEREEKKRQWYQTYSVGVFLWLLSVPITVAIGLSLPVWSLKFTVFAVEQVFAISCYIGLSLLFSPYDWVPFSVVLVPDDDRTLGSAPVVAPTDLSDEESPLQKAEEEQGKDAAATDFSSELMDSSLDVTSPAPAPKQREARGLPSAQTVARNGQASAGTDEDVNGQEEDNEADQLFQKKKKGEKDKKSKDDSPEPKEQQSGTRGGTTALPPLRTAAGKAPLPPLVPQQPQNDPKIDYYKGAIAIRKNNLKLEKGDVPWAEDISDSFGD
mmetsp:Transcript_51066/g.100094  ORF Transcript_51066/g.100094 Transcript_51066/m.100094 type:complete len:597 (+) Transcript_51066:54-1844(+)|eukprot:CAMPEP_0175134466 /NCGR_PEP_ID=MMETSP0087-20121206/8195_1 /TAXON_ID=136419 /ORGANISM="Unknown Unknown, Strain D1" /LENGTH=596 /DNA_ID=CAMNT_0016417033 /DNA_START=35 /DNA_END=1825 /DNA_ORIENTATION=-